MNHKISIEDFEGYQATACCASSSGRGGTKRLFVITDVCTNSVIYEVQHGEEEERFATFQEAVDHYNSKT